MRVGLEALVRRIMPDLALRSVGMTACATIYSPSGITVIDRIADRLGVASGRNRQRAKCSDAPGRPGAQVITGGAKPHETRIH